MTDLLATSRLGAASPVGLLLLQCFGIVTRVRSPLIRKFQVEHVRPIVDWGALPNCSPIRWDRCRRDTAGDVDLRRRESGRECHCAARNHRRAGAHARLPRRVEEQLTGRLVPEADTAPVTQLVASVARGDENSGLDAGVSFFPLRASAPGAADAGLALNPFVHGYANLQFPLAPNTTLEFESTAALDSGVVLQFRPNARPSLKSGLLGSNGVVDSATGKAVVNFKYVTDPGSPQPLLELPGDGIIEVDAVTFTSGVELFDGELPSSVRS